MFARLRRGGSSLYGVDGAIEVCALEPVSGEDELLLSLWPTLAEAGADPGSEWYEVRHDRSRVGRPTVAAVLYFGGPLRGPVRVPGLPGAVRSIQLWQPDRLNQVTVVLAASPPSISDLTPAEVPDRASVYQVVSLRAGCPR